MKEFIIEKHNNIKEKSNPIIEEYFAEYNFEINENENEDEYLHRANSYILMVERKNRKQEKNLAVVNNREYRLHDDIDIWDYKSDLTWKTKYEPVYRKLFTILSNYKKDEVVDIWKNEQVIHSMEITSSSREYSKEINDNFQSIDFFNKTNQTRTFLPSAHKKDDISYASSLFGVNFISDESIKYLKQKLDNKRICLLGGGKSIGDLLTDEKFNVKSITNIDAFLDQDLIERNKKRKYRSINLDASDPILIEKLENEESPLYDEIWASYSVPFYSITKMDIDNLFTNIDKLLDKKGNCRITPLSTQNKECAFEIFRKLREMNSTNKFNFHKIGDTLIIHKI